MIDPVTGLALLGAAAFLLPGKTKEQKQEEEFRKAQSERDKANNRMKQINRERRHDKK